MALETEKQLEKKIRTDCWNQAKQCFGYSYIFTKKAILYEKLLSIINILGLIIPFIIGIVALNGTDSKLLTILVVIGGSLLSLQAIVSAIAVFNKWDDKYSYFIESKIDRSNLSSEYKELGNLSEKKVELLRAKYNVLNAKLQSREKQDAKYEVKEWELRMGMRAALREFQSTCIKCKEQPYDMKPSKCNICGNYKKPMLYKFFKL